MSRGMGIRGPFKVPPWETYYVEVDRKRKSLKTKDLAEARKLVRKIKELYLAGRLHKLTGECSKTLGEFREECVSLAEKTKPASTARADRLALEKLEEVVGPRFRLDMLTKKHIEMMRAKNSWLKPTSLNNYLRHIRSAFNQAVAWGYLRSNPFSGVKELKVPRKQPNFVEQADVGRLLARIKDVDARRIVAAYLATGLRRQELLGLLWGHVDLCAGRFHVFRVKTKRWEWLPINPPFAAVLRSVATAEPDSGARVFSRWEHKDTVSHVVKRALRDAGYGHMRLHDLRHSFASQLAMAGESQAVIAEALGHSQVSTAAIYVHVAREHLSDAVGKIKWGPIDLGG